jgi:hypothetical protein
MRLGLFEIAERLGRVRDELRLVEYVADDELDDELDLRVDATRMALLDLIAWVDELILQGGGEADLEAVAP